ncbi:RrF2 family transcriptional regulator [Candidatus Pelagisphaera phototrophica]|uniref:RrF2 family transcriptional regulator n=1 Tax=Candidatus Pelagisphaera phototrophica TaxID=2684113 RepID=UPI0024B70012|nr:Rrf2 family transcriptional regulator [Candidatus Pelagisphaera phototrophica]
MTVKLEYACRALVQLAKRYEGSGVSSIEELANVEKIPAKYLAQILSELRNGGLVESRRGKQGGYLLARTPVQISISDVIFLIESEMFSESSRVSGDSGEAVAKAWAEIQERFEESVRSITLADLAVRENQEMYYI